MDTDGSLQLGGLLGAAVARRRARQRLLGTLLFCDVGDRPSGWRATLEASGGIVRDVLSTFEGHELKVAGDELVALFEIPSDAVRCGLRLRDLSSPFGIKLRSAVHTGVIELCGGDVCGDAVHICRRLLGIAQPDEVLVTHVVVRSGAGLVFDDRGERRLDGVDGTWWVFSAEGDRDAVPVPPGAAQTVTSRREVRSWASA